MRCPNVFQLAEYLEGICAPRVCQRIANHIDECAQCQQEVAALQQTSSMLVVLPIPRIPRNLWPGVASRINIDPRRTVMPWLWRTAAGVGLAVSLFVGILAVNQSQQTLPYATAATDSYMSQHQLLSARDPLADRASIGVSLAADQGSKK